MLKPILNKLSFALMIFLLFIPIVFGAEDSCGLTNLASCIPEKIYDFIINILNAPLQPLLQF